MISHNARGSRRVQRVKQSKIARIMERLYREAKCKDCSVVVTKMDFAKILGKFTKVKIQYESSTSPKSQKAVNTSTPKSSARIKNHENGIVQNHRKINNKHQENSKSQKNHKIEVSLHQTNVLKERNVLKQKANSKNLVGKVRLPGTKQYAIFFSEPESYIKNDFKSGLSLADLLPLVDKHILPSEDWCINYFPIPEDPNVDKVYDRIAAELEDLMCNDKPLLKTDKPAEDKSADEFPSIMDILNDNITVNSEEQKDHSSALEFKSSLDSSDVEAMLLGKSDIPEQAKEAEARDPVEPNDVDNTDVTKLINDVVETSVKGETSEQIDEITEKAGEAMEIDIPHSPSILDEALQKGIEEHLPNVGPATNIIPAEPIVEEMHDKNGNHVVKSEDQNGEIAPALHLISAPEVETETQTDIKENGLPQIKFEEVTHVTFKKLVNGRCCKMVTCPKNMKYNIELEDKSVELLGAPKYISSLDDLQVLLQIVNESHLESLHVLH